MSTHNKNRFFPYFKHPLLGISGYSSYRMPNSAVHLPVVLMISYLGIMICRAEAKFLLPLYFIVALYTARDMIVLSYKSKRVPVVIWVCFVIFFIAKKEIADFLTFHSFRTSATLTAAALTGFLLYICTYAKNLIK